MLKMPKIGMFVLCVLAFSFGLAGCDLGAISVNDKVNNKKDPTPKDNNTTKNNNTVDPAEIDPGHVTIHRLNSAEYNNTVRDLLGLSTNPADVFPPDDFGFGFNNVANVLTISPLLFEMYETTATTLVDQAMKVSSGSQTTQFEAEDASPTVGAASGDAWNLWSQGELGKGVDFPEDGEYRVTVRAYESKGGPDPARMELFSDAGLLKGFDVTATSVSPANYTYTGTFTKGNNHIGVRFTNDFYDPDKGEDRNLFVDWVRVEGPIGATVSNANRDKIMVCQPADDNDMACIKQIISAFGARAWRRPLTSVEVDALAKFVDVAKSQNEGWDAGLRLAMRALLLSPKFIFRVEFDQTEAKDPYDLSQYELANRLSYFLWSTMPDARLFELARDGKLNDDETLKAEVTRMLADDRAIALIDNFATQWLYIDSVLDAAPDYELYPEFTPALAQSMRTETRMFISNWFQSNEPLKSILTANYSYLNEALANHYGIAGVSGEMFRRVDFDAQAKRRGLLTHGGLLTARSYPNRTSPVLRGVWVLEQLMCSEPPPPPADVEGLKDEGVAPDATLRERLVQHRKDPACFGCHQIMDPIGFGLENYNAVGIWRTKEKGKPVDSLGELPDGRSFTGAIELADVLADDPKLYECMTEKMMTYALGRGIHAKYAEQDYAQVHAIAKSLSADATTHDLITQIVLSKAFRQKRNPSEKGETP